MCQIFLTRDYYVYICLYSSFLYNGKNQGREEQCSYDPAEDWTAVASHEQNPGNSHPRVDEVSGDTSLLLVYQTDHILLLRHILKSYILMSSTLFQEDRGNSKKNLSCSIQFILNSCSFFKNFLELLFIRGQQPIMIQYQEPYFNYNATYGLQRLGQFFTPPLPPLVLD